MSNSPTFDPSIPVLTEVFKEQPAVEPGSGPADLTPSSEPAATGSGPADLTPSSEPAAIAEEADPQWQALEQRLVERILQRLQEELGGTLKQIVTEAVAHEVAQLKSIQK
jgi:hypothetical protein